MELSQLSTGKLIAKSADSRIYYGLYKNDQPVAVKILKHENHEIIMQQQLEVKLLSRLHHTNVVEIVASCTKSPFYCILTEFCSEGSLRFYLSRNPQRLSVDKITDIGLQIARGMEHVHSQGIIHRNMKPENVLIQRDFHLKVAGFGSSCDENNNDFRDVGSLRWMAPEMVSRKKYGRKVDVYSFGLILFEMVSGSIPFYSMRPYQVASGVANNNLKPKIPQDCPQFLRVLIQRCCSKNPKKRPEFSEIVKVLERFDRRRRRSSPCNNKGLMFCFIKIKKFFTES